VRNKIKIEKIENSKIRQVTFYKRKRGLLKKAMELSLLCESKIFLCIVDKVEKLTIYSSENDINKFLGTYIQKLNQSKTQKDILSNNDYKTLFISASAVSEDSTSKFPEDNVIYSFENDQNEEESKQNNNMSTQPNNVEYDENATHNEEKMNMMNFGADHFDHFGLNPHEKESDFNMYLNNQHHTLFEDDQEHNTLNYKFKVKNEDESPLQQTLSHNKNMNMNQIFSTVFSTDNTGSAVSTSNNQFFKTQKAGCPNLSQSNDKKKQ